MDKKLKGIGVHYYANTRLKPKQVLYDGELIEVYPLYVTVVYGQENTKFKAKIDGESLLVSEDLSQLNNPALKEKLERYATFIRSMVEMEASSGADNYSVKGLGRRLPGYTERLLVHYRGYIEINYIESYFESIFDRPLEKGDFDMILYPYILLKKEASDLTNIEWMYGDGKKRFAEILQKHGYKEIEKIVQFYDEILFVSPSAGYTPIGSHY